MNTKPIYVSRPEKARLTKLIEEILASGVKSKGAVNLKAELDRATIVDESAISEDIVTLNSTVTIRDLDTGEIESYSVTMPEHANPSEDRISILSPIGTGLLGYAVGDDVSWETPGGQRRLKIESVKPFTPPKRVIEAYLPAGFASQGN